MAWQRFEGAALSAEDIVGSLGYLESRLREAAVLEVHSGSAATFSVLLDWLRPRRIVRTSIASVSGDEPSGAKLVPTRGDGFDAIFVSISSSSAERELRLELLARMLSPSGLLVLIRPRGSRHRRERWLGMRRRLERLRFEIVDESAGSAWILVANVLSRGATDDLPPLGAQSRAVSL